MCAEEVYAASVRALHSLRVLIAPAVDEQDRVRKKRRRVSDMRGAVYGDERSAGLDEGSARVVPDLR